MSHQVADTEAAEAEAEAEAGRTSTAPRFPSKVRHR